MNSNNSKIPGTYLLAISDLMNDFGIEQAEWLRESPYSYIEPSLASEPIPFTVFSALALRAMSLSKNPNLGVVIGQRLTLQSHGILGYTILNCSDLLSAAKLLEKYISLRVTFLKIKLCYVNNNFSLQLEESFPLNEMQRFLLDAVLFSIKSIFSQLNPSLNKKITISFPYDRQANTNYEDLSDCSLLFNQLYASVCIPKLHISNPILFSSSSAYIEAEALCKKELSQLVHEDSYTNKVKRKLLANTENFPPQNIMSSMFNMTSRTFHRRLVDEGTSYREILDSIKKQLAINYIENSELSVKEISYCLGYDGYGSFNRAFQRWTNLSPSEYRLSIL